MTLLVFNYIGIGVGTGTAFAELSSGMTLYNPVNQSAAAALRAILVQGTINRNQFRFRVGGMDAAGLPENYFRRHWDDQFDGIVPVPTDIKGPDPHLPQQAVPRSGSW